MVSTSTTGSAVMRQPAPSSIRSSSRALELDLSGNTYRYDVKLEHSTAHSIPVTDENVEICRHAAHAAADHPLTLTDMSLY